MVAFTAQYIGGLKCTAVHEPSQTQIITDAPVDIGGTAQSFSPTDLVATALLTCIMTTMALYAERHDVNLEGMTGSIDKKMRLEAPRRIEELSIKLYMPLPSSHPMRERLESIAFNCPVLLSLHPDIKETMSWVWAN